jgi:hypothetical protein
MKKMPTTSGGIISVVARQEEHAPRLFNASNVARIVSSIHCSKNRLGFVLKDVALRGFHTIQIIHLAERAKELPGGRVALNIQGAIGIFMPQIILPISVKDWEMVDMSGNIA